MATSTSPLARQPDKLDYASPTQFRFGIHQLPKVEFFTIGANLPGISADVSNVTTPFKDIPMMGDILAYENLSITFIVDEYLENYTSLHNWMTGYGFPKSREQFSTFRDETSNTPATPKAKTSAETVKRATPDKAIYADAFILILSNKNNPIIEIAFQNVFPISLGALDFTQTATDVEYITTTAEFAYQIYEIKTL
ncbi:MAG: hypothetical protein QGH83_12190 [Candidatus Pacebacteria bacterium]|nr:hypothetical protein [Candidatus Paceibacterota bacterium]